VLLPVGQREKNKKDRRSQGEQVLQFIWNAIGARYMSNTDISIADMLSRSFVVTEIHTDIFMRMCTGLSKGRNDFLGELVHTFPDHSRFVAWYLSWNLEWQSDALDE